MNPYDIIFYFYPQDTPLRRLLVLHSEKVRDKALSILHFAQKNAPTPAMQTIDEQLVVQGALLHDIGIGQTHAPSILCEGTEPYICHGTIGAQMLRCLPSQLLDQWGLTAQRQESLARICERHTGAGLTAEDIICQNLPITPVRDYVPESLEEQLVCLADKFFSKSGDPSKEKDLAAVRRSMMKFGADSLARFDDMCDTFSLK